jgi:hypothetical protein
VETLTDFIPTPNSGETSGDDTEASRIMEGFHISFEDSDPCHTCSSTGIGCGERHPVPIGRLRRGRGGWRVDNRYFAPSCN